MFATRKRHKFYDVKSDENVNIFLMIRNAALRLIWNNYFEKNN